MELRLKTILRYLTTNPFQFKRDMYVILFKYYRNLYYYAGIRVLYQLYNHVHVFKLSTINCIINIVFNNKLYRKCIENNYCVL